MSASSNLLSRALLGTLHNLKYLWKMAGLITSKSVLWITNCRAGGQLKNAAATSSEQRSWLPSWQHDAYQQFDSIDAHLLPNFIAVQFETTDPSAFLKSVTPTKKTKKNYKMSRMYISSWFKNQLCWAMYRYYWFDWLL